MNLAAVLLLFAFQAADPTADGVKALEAGNYPEAIRLLKQGLDKDSTDYYAQFNLSLAYAASRQDALAVDGYRKTLVLKPKLYEAELNLGILLIRNHESKDAIAILEDAQSQKPKELRPAFSLAEAYLETAQYGKAEAAYKTALEIDPKSGASELGLARAMARQGQIESAEKHYQKAAEIDPRYSGGILELAQLCEDRKQFDRAIELYKQLPESPEAQEKLGGLLLAQNKNDDAVAPLEFAVAKAPNSTNRVALVEAYIRSKHPEKALPFVDQLIAANPKDFDLYMVRGRIYRDQRNFKEAARSFNAATNVKPDSVQAWNDLAAMLISLEDYPHALAVFDHLREMHAEQPPHLFFRAIILDKMKQRKPAVAAYKQFLEVAGGKYLDQEFQARQRVRIIEAELNKR